MKASNLIKMAGQAGGAIGGAKIGSMICPG
jgi:hypothetical protein